MHSSQDGSEPLLTFLERPAGAYRNPFERKPCQRADKATHASLTGPSASFADAFDLFIDLGIL